MTGLMSAILGGVTTALGVEPPLVDGWTFGGFD
jgi:hypothetical protein